MELGPLQMLIHEIQRGVISELKEEFGEEAIVSYKNVNIAFERAQVKFIEAHIKRMFGGMADIKMVKLTEEQAEEMKKTGELPKAIQDEVSHETSIDEDEEKLKAMSPEELLNHALSLMPKKS